MTVPDDAPPLSADERRTARGQMLLALIATSLFGLALILGLELATEAPRATPLCTPDTEDRDCGPEEECIGGRCRPLRPLPEVLACQEGDPCDGACTCTGAFSCDADQRCSARREDMCGPEVATLLADLQGFERSQCNKVGEDASQCSPRALAEFFISHQQFDGVLLGLRQTMTVHFDSRRSGQDLTPRQQRFYQARFERLADRFRQAKSVLIVARASQDGREDLRAQSLNYLVAQARLDAVARWIVALEPSPAGQEAMAKKLTRLAIGTSHPLRAEVLARNPEHHYVAWVESQEALLRYQVQHVGELDPQALARMDRILNQSVLIAPIPCELPTMPTPQSPPTTAATTTAVPFAESQPATPTAPAPSVAPVPSPASRPTAPGPSSRPPPPAAD
ncbi:MAG: hypothetical protein H0T76_04380, partial [Nannocystis sp.]|nr:hypothetical protein [Nannocystis sp.]